MVNKNPRDPLESPLSPLERDFSDRVQGEDLEFRASDDGIYRIIHKKSQLYAFEPSKLLSKFTATQLVTISGAASGFLAGVVVCPLDVVKTRFQAQGAMAQSTGSLVNKEYRGFLGAFKTILREEGIRGLYRGLVPITIGYLPTWTIYFTIYERAKLFYPDFLKSHFNLEIHALNHFCSALTAGMTSSIAVNPIWVVKTRLMIQTGSGTTIDKSIAKDKSASKPKIERTYYKGTLDAIRTMYKEEGIRVFYSGLIPSLFGLLHVGIHFPVYEKLKLWLECDLNSTTSDQQQSTLGRLIIASSVSKMIASTITYPHEILRTRMQVQSSNGKKSDKHKGKLISSIVKIYQKEGFKGFYAGYGINLVRTVPASAVTLVSFEYFKTYLLEVSGKQ
ncbi:unnamed protein product [Debaryomyces fabryi]|nr:unnamed protein product [Debaryomyces fabryi]